MYDEFDNYWYLPDEISPWAEDLRQFAEPVERQYLSDEPLPEDDDGDYEDLLNELEFPF